MRDHPETSTARYPRPSALRLALLSALCATASAPALAQTDLRVPATAPAVATASGPASSAATTADQATPAQTGTAPADGTPQATTLDKVEVTGIRSSIQSSISKKRDETVVADVLSADDIGDLPALSIGEAIDTITGASTHREKGGATEISIRGLGPFLSSASFNGREASNGSGDRSVNFNQFPAELINTVAIYKTQRADFVEGGIAGTINMETVKPLSFGERRIQVEGQGSYAEDESRIRDGDAPGWRGTASYLDQFDLGDAGKLGVSVGAQSLRGNNPEETFSSSSTWVACNDTLTVADNSNCNAPSSDPNRNLTPGNYRKAGSPPYYLISGSRTYRQMDEHDARDAAFAAVQWRPSDALELNLDYQRSKRDYVEDRSELAFSETLRGINDRVVSDKGALLHYTGNSSIESNSDYKNRLEDYTGGGFNAIWRPNAAWMFSTDLSYSRTVRDEIDRATRLRANGTDIDGDPVPGIVGGRRVGYTYDYHGDVPSIVVDPLFDLDRWENFSDAARIRRDQVHREHVIRAARFDGAFYPESGWLSALKAGLRLSDATYEDYNDRIERNPDDDALTRAANIACRTPFPQDDFLDDARGNTIDHYPTFDSRCLFRAFTGVDDTGHSADTRDNGNSDVEEKTRALYLMGEFRSELFGLPVSGNLGVRWIRTDVRSVGQRADLAVENNADGSVRLVKTGAFGTPTVIRASDDVVLPSVNAAFELKDDLLLRAAAYRAMARPDLSGLSAGRVFTTDVDFDSLEDALDSVTASGNPRTTPLLSWNADLSLEWYPNPDTLLSAALYYKQFTGGAIPTVVDETFVIDGDPVVIPVTQQTTTDKKSDLVGLELTGSYRFSSLPAPFDGLGVKASYNYADSNFETQDLRLGDQVDPASGAVTPGIIAPVGIFGLSRNVASGSLFYTIGPVDLQAIYKYRSQYYQKFVGDPAQNRTIRDNATLDFRASWRVNAHLSMSLEASNLTNEPKISDMPVPGSFHEYHSYGRRYYLGVRYRF